MTLFVRYQKGGIYIAVAYLIIIIPNLNDRPIDKIATKRPNVLHSPHHVEKEKIKLDIKIYENVRTWVENRIKWDSVSGAHSNGRQIWWRIKPMFFALFFFRFHTLSTVWCVMLWSQSLCILSSYLNRKNRRKEATTRQQPQQHKKSTK